MNDNVTEWSTHAAVSQLSAMLRERGLRANIALDGRHAEATWLALTLTDAEDRRVDSRMLLEDAATRAEAVRRVRKAILALASEVDPTGPWISTTP